MKTNQKIEDRSSKPDFGKHVTRHSTLDTRRMPMGRDKARAERRFFNQHKDVLLEAGFSSVRLAIAVAGFMLGMAIGFAITKAVYTPGLAAQQYRAEVAERQRDALASRITNNVLPRVSPADQTSTSTGGAK